MSFQDIEVLGIKSTYTYPQRTKSGAKHLVCINTFYCQIGLKDHFRKDNQLKNQIIE